MKRFTVLMVFTALCALNIFSAEKLKVENKVKYSNKGTKSEGRHWYLYINDIYIPDVFNKIYCGPDHSYIFLQRNAMWGDDGYFKNHETTAILQSDKPLSDGELNKGWYLGNEKLKNTPDSWIYVQWQDKVAFVDYKKLNDFIKEFNLKTIAREIKDLDSLK